MKIKILSWNVRGVNDPDKSKVIKNFLRTHKVDLVCLQKTKVQEMNNDMVHSLRVGHFLNWKALNAEGSAKGILLLWDNSRISMVDSVVGSFSVSCLFRMQRMGTNGLFPWCMARLRRVLEHPFGKSLVRSKAFGKIHGASTVISMRFSLITKYLEGAGFPKP